MKLKITNTKTNKVWIEENRNHSWREFALDLIKEHKKEGHTCNLIYCDIEGIVCLNDIWYILDECGNWEYILSTYKVEKGD